MSLTVACPKIFFMSCPVTLDPCKMAVQPNSSVTDLSTEPATTPTTPS